MGDKPRKSGDMSDMAHRIKTLNGKPFVRTQIPREMISNPRVTIAKKGE
jgi:hypothetical protein